MRAATLLLFPLAVLPSAAIAQDHQHDAQAPNESEVTAPSRTPAEPPAGDRSGMDHATMDHGTMDHSAMNHGTMGHGTPDRGMMEHGPMGHSGMEHSAMPDDTPIPQGPPPPEAFEGPAFAADAFVGAERMAASRASVVREVSGLPVFWFQADRAEYRAREGKDGYLWDVQGYYGGDLDKFWFKSEGEGSFGEKPEAAEVQGLWSHAIGPWWDLQLGARQDLTGPERTYAVDYRSAAVVVPSPDLRYSFEQEINLRVDKEGLHEGKNAVDFHHLDFSAESHTALLIAYNLPPGASGGVHMHHLDNWNGAGVTKSDGESIFVRVGDHIHTPLPVSGRSNQIRLRAKTPVVEPERLF